ncbi:L-serine dehydratase [Desulfitispora alkaliphila]|uniref:L-serine ammonia-lyase, iron-sulfur-dependent, subunit alpha n=1 Tax=Desulfitispora alkaliphila TaxID=622674 RepID=UPI003D1CC03E
MFHSIAELAELASLEKTTIGKLVLQRQAKELEKSEQEVWKTMLKNYQVMVKSANVGIEEPQKSFSGLVGYDGRKVFEQATKSRSLVGEVVGKAIGRSLAVAEVNAAMGKIVAAPTAGSCGILPAVLMGTVEKFDLTEEKAVYGLFTAAGIGMVIATKASISGAEGGCQAECGSASGMAAAAAVEMAGGSPEQAINATAIALKNTMGLTCDPVAGLVEVPCVKRNAMATVNAMCAAEMALANIKSVIPVDEVVKAMKEVGDAMPAALRETAIGGLAGTPTAKKIEKDFLGK